MLTESSSLSFPLTGTVQSFGELAKMAVHFCTLIFVKLFLAVLF